jgi:hypothetical protein
LLTLEDYPLKSNFRQLLNKFRFDVVVIVESLGAL